MGRAMNDVLAERQRQIWSEGWTPKHDNNHRDGEMLTAAVIYMHHGTDRASPIQEDGAPLGWPWEPRWWKPKDRRRNLVRAGALCLAEKERLVRAHAAHVAMKQHVIDSGRTVHRVLPPGPFTAHVEQKLTLIIAEIERLDRAAISGDETGDGGGKSAAK